MTEYTDPDDAQVGESIERFLHADYELLSETLVEFWSRDAGEPSSLDWVMDVLFSTEVQSDLVGYLDLLEYAMQRDSSGRLVPTVALGPLDNLLAGGADLNRVEELSHGRPRVAAALSYWVEHGYGV